MTPSARTFSISFGSSMPAVFIASQVRCKVRPMPVSPAVDLEGVGHVIEQGPGLAEIALLLDGSRLGVALDDDQPAQHGAIFARHLLPGRLAVVAAERNFSAFLLWREQDAPPVF